MDLSDVRQTSSYCDRKALAVIRGRLRKHKTRPVVFLGTGNYHYVSYLLLEDVELPFTLVLFDYHTDMLPPLCESVTSCGSWVMSSIERFPLLKHVVIIGAKGKRVPTIPARYREVVSVFTDDGVGWRDQSKKAKILSAIPTDDVYVSIDKDVLSEHDAITNWDQGSMRLEQLLELIGHITMHKNVCGLDICGEYPLSFAKGIALIKKAARTNERANRSILRTVLKKRRCDRTPQVSA